MFDTYSYSYLQTRQQIVRRRAWIVTALALLFWLIVPPVGLFFSVVAIGAGVRMLMQNCSPRQALAIIAIGGVLPLALFALIVIQNGGTFH